MHLDKRFAAARLRLGKIGEPQNIRIPILLENDRLHLVLRSTCNPLAIHKCRVALADACQSLEFCIPKTLVFNSRTTQPSNNPN